MYALRYDDQDKIKQLKSDLRISEDQSHLIDCALQYAGKSQRKADLFGDNTSLTGGAKRLLNSMFGEDVKNVLLQHKSWLHTSILEPFSRDKLDEMRYPYCPESRPSLGLG